MSKDWIKSWIQEELHGPDEQDFTPAERYVWHGLKLLAGKGDPEGTISRSLRSICKDLNISHCLLEWTLRICRDTGRIQETDQGIVIVNWFTDQQQLNKDKVRGNGHQENNDPNKYIKGKYGHIVRR